MSRQCGYIKPSGEGCRGTVRRGDTYCWAHDRKYEEARKRGQARGGRGRVGKKVATINARLEELAEQVIAKEVDRADAAVAGQIFNYVLRGMKLSLEASEYEELLPRLEQIEERVHADKERGQWGA